VANAQTDTSGFWIEDYRKEETKKISGCRCAAVGHPGSCCMVFHKLGHQIDNGSLIPNIYSLIKDSSIQEEKKKAAKKKITN